MKIKNLFLIAVMFFAVAACQNSEAPAPNQQPTPDVLFAENSVGYAIHVEGYTLASNDAGTPMSLEFEPKTNSLEGKLTYNSGDEVGTLDYVFVDNSGNAIKMTVEGQEITVQLIWLNKNNKRFNMSNSDLSAISNFRKYFNRTNNKLEKP